MGLPVNSSEARLAWATSMASPPAQGSPRSSAARMRAVRRGLNTTSSTPVSWGKASRDTGEAPLWGYIPTGVVLMRTWAPAWRERLP